MTIAVFVVSLCVPIIVGVPIAFALLICAVALMFYLNLFDPRILTQNLVLGADNFALMAIPFFILVGQLMNASGISRRIVQLGICLVGHIRGGLGYVAILTAFIFAGLSGSAVADTAALAAIMVPMMAEAGYSKSRAAALIGAGSIVAPILPPSIPFIILASVSGLSVMKLFMAGIVPAIILSVSLAVMWRIIAGRESTTVFPRSSLKQILVAAKDAAWGIALPIFIIIGIKGGVVTPTEAAVAAAFYTMFLCFVVYRSLSIERFVDILVQTAKTSSVILFLSVAAMVSAWLIAIANLPTLLAELLQPFMDHKIVLMLVINLLVYVVGTAMDLLPTVLILTPVLLPVVVKAGIDPIYFGVIFILNNAIGLLTPPVGTVLNAACGAGRVSMDSLMKDIIPFLLIETAVLLVLILFPDLVLLPARWLY